MLADGAAVLELDAAFGPSFCFSPSQLETYIACPFQFFSKYVLNLKPVDEQDELDEDYTERGSQIHDILENFERKVQQGLADEGLERIAAIEIDRIRNVQPADATDLDLGLWEIERGRLVRTIHQYVQQRKAYERDGEFPSTPYEFELKFGERDAAHPILELGHGSRTIRLRGRIDRIDLVQTAAGSRFRVIDYKSGSVPSSTDVKYGEMLQLPLYAMAVAATRLRGRGDGRLLDLGYWSLRNEGFKPIAFGPGRRTRRPCVAHVLATGRRASPRGLRGPVAEARRASSYCDYRASAGCGRSAAPGSVSSGACPS